MKNLLTVRHLICSVFLLGLIALAFFFPLAPGLALAFVLPAVPVDNKLKSAKDALGAIQKRMDEILALNEKEKRRFNDAETKEYGELETRYVEIKAVYDCLNENEKRKKDLANNGGGFNADNGASGKHLFGPEEVKSINKKFNLGKAISVRMAGNTLDGIEAEIEKEGIKSHPGIARSTGKELVYHIPWFMVEYKGTDKKADKRSQDRREREFRTITIGTEGTDVMQVNLGELIPALRPSVITESLGVKFLTGLQGDFQFPRKSGVSSVTWLTETGGASASTPTFDNIKLSPKRVAGYIDMSIQSDIQSNFPMQNVLIQDLENELGIEMDNEILNGPGTGNKPTGIVNTSGVGSIVGGTNGAALTWAQVLSFLSNIWTGNVPENGLKWLGTMQAKAKFMSTDKTAGNFGRFILDDPFNMVAGYPFNATNQLPSNGTKGTSSGICSTLVFGNWGEAYTGLFGGVNLVTDPYTQRTSGAIRLYIEQFMDVKLRHAASFAVCTDQLTA